MSTQLKPDLTPEQENELVTKGYFKNELKNELDQRFSEFSQKMFQTFATKADFNELTKKVGDIDLKLGSLLTGMDIITKQFKDHQESHDMNQAAHDRFDTRLTVVEDKLGIKSEVRL